MTLPARRLMPLPSRRADPNYIRLNSSTRRFEHLMTRAAIKVNACLFEMRGMPEIVKLVRGARTSVKFYACASFSVAISAITQLLPG
jgi:hypothetical protein